MQEEYGVLALWFRGDWVIRTTAILLVVMSVVSWTVIVVKTWDIWRAHREKKRAMDAFDHESNPLDVCIAQPNSCWERLRRIVHKVSRHKADAVNESWFSETVNLQIEREVSRFKQGLPLLSSIASTAPFVGLFGTVVGIYHTMTTLGTLASVPSIADVAGPVGETLIMTACGLAVAIPSAMAYNLLLRSCRRLELSMIAWVGEFRTILVAGKKLDDLTRRGL